MSANELAAAVRKGIGAGERLVPGTMSQEEADALIALDQLRRLALEAESAKRPSP